MNGNSERPVAVVTMADGSEMRFVLRPDKAPATVANFVDLAEKDSTTDFVCTASYPAL